MLQQHQVTDVGGISFSFPEPSFLLAFSFNKPTMCQLTSLTKTNRTNQTKKENGKTCTVIQREERKTGAVFPKISNFKYNSISFP